MLGWLRSWNKIIREVIWNDQTLKQLMKIPARTGVLPFTERYFIKSEYTSKLLTDEICRIVYSVGPGYSTDVPNVRQNIIVFDIYVKQEEMNNVGEDRLVTRADYIASRLFFLLTKDRYVADTGYRFWPAPVRLDNGTRTTGYVRKTIGFYFMEVD